MLKLIEPLDSSDISKFVSESAKDSMKQTISTTLGILPSDHFSVSVRVSELPLHRLLVSSIITGYTLWNAEYLVSLMRNFDLSLDCSKACNLSEGSGVLGVHSKGKECEGVASTEVGVDSPNQVTSDSLKGLSPETLSYIEQLEAELCSAKQMLRRMILKKWILIGVETNNSLLQYLRSLESYMVTELSQPSSVEAKQVIYELVQNTIQKTFKDVTSAAPIENTAVGSVAEQEVYVVGSSLKRLGEQITPKLRRRIVVKSTHICMYIPPLLVSLRGNLLYSERNCSIIKLYNSDVF